MVFTDDGIDISTIEEHPENASFSIDSTDDGIDTSTSDEHWQNVYSSIFVVVEGIIILVSFKQFLK